MSRAISLIVIHCSASPNGRPLSSETIDAWHRDRGFAREPKLIGFNEPTLRHIGYHYVIHTNGVVRIGRGEREVGAHVAGHNRHSIGICLVGTSAYTAAQWRMLQGLVSGLNLRYPEARVLGHRDLSPDRNGDGTVQPHEWLKTCPGFDVAAWRRNEMQPLPGHVLEVSP